MSQPESALPQLSISVIISTCDRRDSLRTLLYALNRQTYQNFEVIVVLGPTKDDSYQMLVQEFAGQIHLVRCPEFNLSVSRNMGLARAAGEIVAFIDDDAVPSLTWLEQIAAAYADPNVAGVGGRTYQIYPDIGALQFLAGMVSVLAEQEDVRLNPAAPIQSNTPSRFWFPRLMGTNMTYRRKTLLTVNGFDEHFEYLFDDADIGVRLGLNGYLIKHLTEGVVYHVPASGRNREVFTWNINWYTWLKCTIYFALKNGSASLGLYRTLLRTLEHTLDFYRRVRELHGYGAFSDELYLEVRSQLSHGWQWGLWHGLFRPRAIPAKIQLVEQEFNPFLKPDSARYPALSPFGIQEKGKVKPMDAPPLRICLLSLKYPPRNTEGIARHTHTIAQGLAELGHEVHVITQGHSPRVTYYDGAYVHEICLGDLNRYHRLMNSGYMDTCWWLNHSHAIFEQVKSLQINDKIQVVDSPLWQLEGLVTCVSGDVPVAVRLATAMKQIAEVNEQINPDTQLISQLETEFLKLCCGFTANSCATTQTLKQVYGLDFEIKPHRIIYHGIIPVPDQDIYPLTDQPKNEPIILFLGRLEKRKGILDLFAAIPYVLREFPQAQFWLAGEDNSHNDGFKKRQWLDYPTYFTKKYPHCINNVKFLGFVPDVHLKKLFQVCDLFVAPSLYESFGLIYIEAMNYARPVIGCNIGGPAEIIVDGETGFLVPPQTPEALAEAMIKMLSDSRRRKEMGLAGRQRLLNHFTHIKMAEGFVDFYRQLLK